MSVRMMQIILVLAPLFLGLSIWAYFRLRRHVCDSPDPIVVFRRMRWNSLIIAFGGVIVYRGALSAPGIFAWVAGSVLALEFFYVA